MKAITVHYKNGNKIAIVDDEDFEYLNQFTWYLMISKCGILYARARHIDSKNKRRLCFMHRVVMGLINSRTMLDHIDRDGLNNQKKNLRKANHSQNGVNTILSKYNKTGYRGVIKQKSGVFRVMLYSMGKAIHGGVYMNPVNAAKRYNELARQYHGEFAYQNPV